MRDLSMDALIGASPPTDTPPPPDRSDTTYTTHSQPETVVEDAAFLLEDLNARIALEHLLYYVLEGGLWESAWYGVLEGSHGFNPDEWEDAWHELQARGLVVDYWRDTELGGEPFCSVTDRGHAAAERAAAEDVAGEERKRIYGLLTYGDLWAHDVLIEEGPLTWEAWKASAKPLLYEARTDEWVKAGKLIGEDGNARFPPEDPEDFDRAAARLLGRQYVERRDDGLYAAILPQVLKPETVKNRIGGGK